MKAIKFQTKEMRTVTFKAEQELVDMIDRFAIKHRLSRSEVVRKAIELLVMKELKNEKVPKAKVIKIRLY